MKGWKKSVKKIGLFERVRIWLLHCLGGVSIEKYDRMAAYAGKLKMEHSAEKEQYRTAIREICRRSDSTYYDWCCDRCGEKDCARNGWCDRFKPI